MTRNNWTREQTILALDLYVRQPFGKMNQHNEEVIKLANIIGRTPSAVVRKIGNIAHFDPAMSARGVNGLEHCSKLDGEVYEKFANNLEELAYKVSEIYKDTYRQKPPISAVDLSDLPSGVTRDTIVKQRVGQAYFRDAVLNVYGHRCCITGVNLENMLLASHIKPWAVSNPTTERTNPANGLCLNPFHDRAFDQGLITLSFDFKVIIGKALSEAYMYDDTKEWIKKYEGVSIRVPQIYIPKKEFIEYHQDVVFKNANGV